MVTKTRNFHQAFTEKSHLLGSDHGDILVDDGRGVKSIISETVRGGGHAGSRDAKCYPEDGGRDRRVIFWCFAMNFLTGCTLHGLSPFYPPEAGSKHVSVSITGLTFSVFEFVRFLIADPVITKWLLPRFGVKVVYVVGLALACGSCFAFSATTSLHPGVQFVLVSVVCRSGQAMGTSGLSAALSAIVHDNFPTSRPTRSHLKTKDIGTTLGCIAGPVVGGCLYSIGGFDLPFYVIGTTTLISGLFLFWSVSFPNNTQSYHCNVSCDTQTTTRRLLSNPTIIFSAMSVFTYSSIVASLDPILSNHVIDCFGLSTSVIGLLFAIPPSVNAVLVPLWRRLAEDEDIRTPCYFLGHIVIVAGCLVIGPTQLLPFVPVEIWTTVVGLVLIGAGNGCVLLIAIASMNSECVPKDITTNTGLDLTKNLLFVFDVSYFLGGLAGPIFGAVLMDWFGFRVTTSAMACVSATCVVVYVLVSAVSCVSRKCVWVVAGRRQGKGDMEHLQDCDRCAMRRMDGTFGVLPTQTQRGISGIRWK